MKRKIFTILLAAAAPFTGCIEPLVLTPDIEGEITAFEVEGQTRTPAINSSTRTISVEMRPSANLAAVKVTRLELVETASCDMAAGSVIDLSSPLKTTVTTATGYEWTIAAIQQTASLPGGDFEQWHRADRGGKANPDGKVWNPWAEGAAFGSTRWWDTGNEGVTTLGESNSTPTAEGEGCPANPSGRAARLESKWMLLKAAGGNIFFGRFAGMAGAADAKCDMGHPWSKKPRALKGWFRYFPQMIDQTGSSAVLAKLPAEVRGITSAEWKRRTDSMSVTVALWASPDGTDVPFTVNTQLSQFKDLTRDAEGVIAWGQFTSGETQPDWREFSLDVEYLKTEYLSADVPLPSNARLIVAVTSSKYANYFIAGTTTGGVKNTPGSLMYVDELELVY
jgi:hypothetical protein